MTNPEHNVLPTLAEQLGESFEELLEVTKPEDDEYLLDLVGRLEESREELVEVAEAKPVTFRGSVIKNYPFPETIFNYAGGTITMTALIDKMDRAIKAAETIEQSYQSGKPL